MPRDGLRTRARRLGGVLGLISLLWAATGARRSEWLLAGIELLSFSGKHREIGVQQGRAARPSLHPVVKGIRNLEAVKLAKPRLQPMSLFLLAARRRASKLLGRDILRLYPRQAERTIRGRRHQDSPERGVEQPAHAPDQTGRPQSTQVAGIG